MNHNIPDRFRKVGKEGFLRTGDLEVSIIIIDARTRPDAVDYLVEPTAGTGKMWVDAESVRVPPKG